MADIVRKLENDRWVFCNGCGDEENCTHCRWYNGDVVDTGTVESRRKKMLDELESEIEKTKRMTERGLLSFWEAETRMRELIDNLFKSVPYHEYEMWLAHKKICRKMWRWCLETTK